MDPHPPSKSPRSGKKPKKLRPNPKTQFSIHDLPRDLLWLCFCHLNHFRSYLYCSCVSKTWKSICRDVDLRLWHIDPRQILLGDLILTGRGTVAYEGVYQGFSVTVDVLALHSRGYKNRTTKMATYQETAFRRFPNVIMQYGAYFDTKGTMFVVSENASRGCLADLLSANESISISRTLKIARDISQGLSSLHSSNIVHRNLKMKNVVLKKNWTAKICDFTFSLSMDSNGIVETTKFSGTIKYSSPEILEERYSKKTIRQYQYSTKVDVYAFGILFWEILTNEKAFKKRPRQFLGKEGLARYVLAGNRPPLDPSWSKYLQKFFSACWNHTPKLRPDFTLVLESWDKINLHIRCPDPIGRRIVKCLWGKEKTKTVTFTDLLRIFSEMAFSKPNLISSKISALIRRVVCLGTTGDEKSIKLKQFYHLIGWFGPIDKQWDCQSFFERIKDLTSRNFFVEGHEEARVLVSQKKKKYVVCPSARHVGEFILVYLPSGSKIIQEQPIFNKDGLLILSFGETETSYRAHGWSEAKKIFKENMGKRRI